MFGIPTLAKQHPSPRQHLAPERQAELLPATTFRKPGAVLNSFEHVETTPARILPPSNHTYINLQARGSEKIKSSQSKKYGGTINYSASLNNAKETLNSSNNNINNNSEVPVVITGRRRAPPDNLSCPQNSRGGVHAVPWAESAPGAPTVSTTHEMYQSAEDRDKNYRKHLRKQFRELHLEHLIPSTLTCNEAEIDLERERREDAEYQKQTTTGIPGTARRFVGSGVGRGAIGATDLKLTTLQNTKKKTFHSNRIVPGTGDEGNLKKKFCATIDELGVQNGDGTLRATDGSKSGSLHQSSKLLTGTRKTHIEPFLVYQDQVKHLPAVPQVGITYTARDRPENSYEVVFPWDRPRVGADGAAKLVRQQNRRLVTQRRLEFAEQFLPEICAGMTSGMSKRVAVQFDASRGVAQPRPLNLEPLDNAMLRGPTQVANANMNPKPKRDSNDVGGHGNQNMVGGSDRQYAKVTSPAKILKNSYASSSPRDQQQQQQTKVRFEDSTEERKMAKAIEKMEKKQRGDAVKQKVKDIVDNYEKSLKTHDLIMQVAVTSLV